MPVAPEKRSLSHPQIGIQNYSTTSSCQARASQVPSDYGTLFVVLVVIGAVCLLIIVLGLLYNCWQRRLPKLKHVVSSQPEPGGGGQGAQPCRASVLIPRWAGSDCPGCLGQVPASQGRQDCRPGNSPWVGWCPGVSAAWRPPQGRGQCPGRTPPPPQPHAVSVAAL